MADIKRCPLCQRRGRWDGTYCKPACEERAKPPGGLDPLAPRKCGRVGDRPPTGRKPEVVNRIVFGAPESAREARVAEISPPPATACGDCGREMQWDKYREPGQVRQMNAKTCVNCHRRRKRAA